ncbi:MAG: tetratricopeptide repeat protein [Prevotellaceae bacterium]|jgi:tetratricopeptide (TPR) repeat protein|nr:tetratricopeptide repeat protein [Prevotellaceae bacterium]
MKKTASTPPAAGKRTIPPAKLAGKMPKTVKKKSPDRYKNYVIAAILLLTAVVYSPSLKNDFVAGDDYTIVADNEDIRSLGNIPKFFMQPYHSMYCPVKMISHAVDYRFSAAKPGGYHFFSILYHLMNVALLFVLAYMLFSNMWAAAIGALLFAVHPINAETVCWLTGRGDLLYAGFYLGGLIAYVKYIKSEYRSKYFVYTLLLFVLSGLSKASAMTFPLTLLVLDWFYRRKLFSWRVVAEKAPFFAGSLALGLSAIMLRSAHSVSLSEYFSHFTGIDNFVIFIYPLTFYLAKFFVPLKLALPYPHPFASALPLSLDFYIYPFILVAIAICIWRFKTIRRPLLFTLLVYLTGLVSAMRLTPMLGTIAADRYFYFAMTGVILFIAWMYIYLSERRKLWNRRAFPLFITAVALFSVMTAAMTRTRTYAFKDAITLFGDAHRKYPAHATPLYELTGGYMLAGDREKVLQTAEKITQLLPDDENALGFYANALMAYQQYPKALDILNRMIRIRPDNEFYLTKASIHQQFHQPDSALATAAIVLQNNADSAAFIYAGKLMIDCSMELGYHLNVLSLIDTLIAHYPSEEASLLMSQAISAYESNDMEAAIMHLQRLLQLQPDNATACLNLGKLYASAGNHAEACRYWRMAETLKDPEAKELLKMCENW